jgi:iron(III) transport system substrate-binding protein
MRPIRFNRRNFHRLISGTITALLLVGFGPAFAAEAPKNAADVWPYLMGLPAAERQAVTVREATREGGLTVYGVLGIDRAKFITQAFEKKYPGVKVSFVRMMASAAPQKVNTEHKLGRVQHDIVIASGPILLLLKDSIAPYEPTTWKKFDPRFVEGSAAKGWTAISYEILPMTIVMRTDRLKAGEKLPTTLDEVSNPMWKGRMGITTHLEDFFDAMINLYGEQDGMKRIKKLAALESRTYKSYGSLARAVASGEVDGAWNFGAHRAYWIQKKGVAAKFVFMKPSLGLGVTVSAVKGSPKPYSAALYMDFLTSASTLELLDKLERGHVFGNTEGTYSESLADFSDMSIFQPLTPEKFSKFNRQAEKLFIR